MLMLVVMMLLLVVAATRALLHNELQARRSTQDWIRAQTMLAAIETISTGSDATGDSAITIALPLGQDEDEFLEVTRNDREGEISVLWMRRGESIDQMSRNVDPAEVTHKTDSEVKR